MQDRLRNKSGFGFMVGLGVLAISVGLGVSAATAQSIGAMAAVSAKPQQAALSARGKQSANGSKTAHRSDKRYFIEFRARSAQSYGHTFSVHGRLNARGNIGNITKDQVAGLHPFTESPIPWMMGHIVLVPSETGASDGDTEEEYVTARYRIVMNEAEYTKLVAFIKQLQASSPTWHAVFYNCNAFVADIARFMGLQTPSTTMLYPEIFITQLRELNTGPRQVSAIAPVALP